LSELQVQTELTAQWDFRASLFSGNCWHNLENLGPQGFVGISGLQAMRLIGITGGQGLKQVFGYSGASSVQQETLADRTHRCVCKVSQAVKA
jgi:hypothetical protein